MIRYLLVLSILTVSLCSTSAQTITDHLMMSNNDFCTGFTYTYDQWKNYWEGSIKRDNQNIGTLTTTQLMWVGNYGLTNKINLIAMIPYMKTSVDAGTLVGMDGIQDLTLAIKYQLAKKESAYGRFSAFGIGSISTPITNYSPDYLPLSIGLKSTTVSGRVTIAYRMNQGWYASASGSYVWRSNVSLDRSSYYTDGTIYFTNQVWMPNQFLSTYSMGYHKNGFQTEVNLVHQNTLGGGDIRIQDMPFVSNRMNFLKLGVLGMYYLPKPKNFAIRTQISYTLDGLNMGQSFSIMGGILYTFHFAKKKNK